MSGKTFWINEEAGKTQQTQIKQVTVDDEELRAALLIFGHLGAAKHAVNIVEHY